MGGDDSKYKNKLYGYGWDQIKNHGSTGGAVLLNTNSGDSVH